MSKSRTVEHMHPERGLFAAWFGWVSHVTRYQWLVLLVAWLGWVFDSMDATLYSLVQRPAITELLGAGASDAQIGLYSSVVFSVMLIGWALGGIIFGIVADYIGRTKALTVTILIYSVFTGLSAMAHTWSQLGAFRFITGLGLGGEWAAGAALVAEIWPDNLRAKAGALLQSAAALGFFFAAVLNLYVGIYSWRYVFLIGAVPAVFVMFVRMLVKEPEVWLKAKKRRDQFTLKQLFGPKLRRDTLVASSLAFVVLLGLWGATAWIPAAIGEVAKPEWIGLGAGLPRKLVQLASYGIMLLNAGSLFGYLLFGPMADRFGRKKTFLFYFLGAAIAFPVAFLLTKGVTQLFMLLPVVGFFTLGVTSGFPIYLPELFPTEVRTTGVGFCYNLGRIGTAGGVFITGYLVGLSGSYVKAVSTVSLVYLLGLFCLIMARETRGQRLA